MWIPSESLRGCWRFFMSPNGNNNINLFLRVYHNNIMGSMMVSDDNNRVLYGSMIRLWYIRKNTKKKKNLGSTTCTMEVPSYICWICTMVTCFFNTFLEYYCKYDDHLVPSMLSKSDTITIWYHTNFRTFIMVLQIFFFPFYFIFNMFGGSAVFRTFCCNTSLYTYYKYSLYDM